MSSTPGNALVPANLNLPASPFSDDLFSEVAKVGNYLPRLQQMGFTSKLVQDGKATAYDWVVVRSDTDFTILGKSIDVLVLAWRPKALKINKDGVLAIYDPKNADFLAIAASADAPGAFERGDSYGPEFLVWVPKVGAYTSYFANSKTARKEAGNLKVVLIEFRDENKLPAVTFKGSLRENKSKSQKWVGPNFFGCSTPINPLPDWSKFEPERAKFLNPPKTEKEKLEPEAAGGRTV